MYKKIVCSLLFFSNAMVFPCSQAGQNRIRALYREQNFRSASPITLFVTHADQSYPVYIGDMREKIDKLVFLYKQANAKIVYIGETPMLWTLVADQLTPAKLPNYLSGNFTDKRFMNFKIDPSFYPKDRSPHAVVLSIDGFHNIVSGPTAIVTGGNLGGCSGITAARTFANWILTGTHEGHVWLSPPATYNIGCFDYRMKAATAEYHSNARFQYGKGMKSLEQCLKEFNITSDGDVKDYLNGYLRLLIKPNIINIGENSGVERIDSLPESEYTFLFYNGLRLVGTHGHGPIRYHLHIGHPPIQ